MEVGKKRIITTCFCVIKAITRIVWSVEFVIIVCSDDTFQCMFLVNKQWDLNAQNYVKPSD